MIEWEKRARECDSWDGTRIGKRKKYKKKKTNERSNDRFTKIELNRIECFRFVDLIQLRKCATQPELIERKTENNEPRSWQWESEWEKGTESDSPSKWH